MTVILGPANADHYRIKVGRYGDRWYTDPLPADTIAYASDWHGPSISATKPPFANKYVPMKAIADMADSEWLRLSSSTVDARYEAIKSHDKEASRINMNRGSLIHEWAEDLLHGRPMRMPLGYDTPVVNQATAFQSALQSFFDVHQPELVAAEVVCLHRTLNGVGYGGTADAFARIDGDIWVIDWKSRNSDHAAYLEEAAQGGGYVGAEYMIVTGPNGEPQRALIPDVAGVLIVSIRTDGFKAYPIDKAGAIQAYGAMHRWWVEQRSFIEKKVIGRPWAPKTATADVALETLRDDLRDRIQTLIGAGHTEAMKLAWPTGVPTLATGGHTIDQLTEIAAAVTKVEASAEMPFAAVAAAPARAVVEPAPVPTVEIDDGAFLDTSDIEALRRRMTALPADMQAAVAAVAAEAHSFGHSISVQAKPCVRRWELARALVRWAEWGVIWNGNRDISGDLGSIVGRLATVEQVRATVNDGSIGAVLSLFTIDQARQLHDAFDHPVAA